uniref:Uncharacterized protein n=1 Tax=Anguilla anguilla TaxID=7936 RepID=A0A0E9TSI7_ANGAN
MKLNPNCIYTHTHAHTHTHTRAHPHKAGNEDRTLSSDV